jgi:ribosomal protein L21
MHKNTWQLQQSCQLRKERKSEKIKITKERRKNQLPKPKGAKPPVPYKKINIKNVKLS